MVTKRTAAAEEPVDVDTVDELEPVDEQAVAAAKIAGATVGAPAGDDYERALLDERAGYEKFGRDDRVRGVDAELERHRAARSRAAAAPETVVDRSGDDDGFETA